MFKIIICVLFSLVIFNTEAANNRISNLDTNLHIVEKLDDIKKLHSNSELIELKKLSNQRGQIRYTLGNRVSGDRPVAAGQDSASWSSPQNIQLTLQYPQSGVGAVVTHVEILVDQSSDIGRAYILYGGIGQRQVAIVVEAQSTTRFSYIAAVYGK